jgi:hypothetical protein
VETDPRAAAAALTSIPPGNTYDNAVANLASRWAQNDPEAARAWVQQLPEGRKSAERRPADRSTVDEFPTGRSDGVCGPQYVRVGTHLHARQSRLHLGGTRPGRRVRLGGADASGCEQRTAMETGMVNGLAQHAPREAATYAARLPAGESRDSAVRNVASQWSNVDPASAAAWVSSFPETQIKEQAAGQVISNWLRHDPAAAASWMATLPSGQSRDRVAQTFASQTLRDNPAQATSALELISNPAQRVAAIQSTARQWLAF